MAIKKVLLSKKINNVIYDIFPKTSAEVVVYGESTVAAELAKFAEGLANVYTKSDADAATKASADALYNKIMGITDEDGTTVSEAYDTLKEVAAWISTHGEVATAFSNDISALKTAVGDAESGLVKAVADLQTAVEEDGDDIEALQAAVEALEKAVGDADKALADRVTALEGRMDTVEGKVSTLETTVGDTESGLVKKVADLEAKATNVVDSETNGNIVVDGQEIVVYEHPETHSADMIVENEQKQFVTAEEKATFAAAAAVVLVSSQDEVANERDLYMVEI